jgi:cytoskeletal protein CcmA (bactofilin family)
MNNPSRTFLKAVICAVATVLLLAAAATASVYESGEKVTVSRLHTIDDDLWVFADNLVMDGSVTGDALFFGYKGNFDGEVNGSVFSFSRFFSQSGSVDGSVRLLSQDAEIAGFIGRSLEVFAQKFELRQGAVVGRDATLFGSDIFIEGTIRGSVRARGGRVEVTGTIEGDLMVEGDRIILSPPAVVQGNLTYVCADSSHATIDPGVTVLGETVWSAPESEDDQFTFARLLKEVLYDVAFMLAALLFGIIVVRFFKPYALEALRQLHRRTGTSLATGFVGVFVLAACMLVLVIAVLSMLAGTILLGEGGLAAIGGPILVISILLVPITSFCSVTGAVLFYSGKIITAFVIGGLMTNAGREGDLVLRAGPLFVGLVMLTIAFNIPYLGFLIYLGVSIAGGGAIMLGIKHCRAAALLVAASDKSDDTPA